MHHLNMGCQLTVNPNKLQICDGREDDDEENETYWGVRNNDNLKLTDSEVSASHTCRILVLRGIRLGFTTAPGLSPSSATLPGRSVGQNRWKERKTMC